MGIHKCRQGGLSEAEGGQESASVCIVSSKIFMSSKRMSFRDGAYVQFIRPKGPLDQNLRNQLKA